MEEEAPGGGVMPDIGAVSGDPLRVFIPINASWKGLNAGSCLTDAGGTGGTGAFLKVGSFALGFTAEKNDESVLAGGASFSFFAADAASLDVDVDVDIACRFAGGAGFVGSAESLRFRFGSAFMY